MSIVPPTSEIAIWDRVIHPERGDLPGEVANFFLNLSFESHDLVRMHELAVKNQQGDLSPDELDELHNYRQVGLKIDSLRAKARQTFTRRPA